MNGNKTVIAILLSALMICATIYYVGKKPEKIPTITVPESSQSQTTASNAASPTVEEPTPTIDDLALITKALAKRTGLSEDAINVTISKHIGGYAKGGIVEKTSEVGGAQWFAAKKNGAWMIVHDGQDYPKCSALVGYTFPKEILDSCWDETTNKVKSL